MPNLEGDGVQLQSPSPINREQESGATVSTGSAKLKN